MPKLNEFLFGKSPKLKQKSALTAGQENLFNQVTGQLGSSNLYGSGLGLLRSLLEGQAGEDQYNAFAAPYMQQFEQEILPMIGERFAGLGANSGALSSSGFAQALGGAGAGLQSQLGQLREGLRNQALQSVFNQYGNALGQRTFGFTEKPGSSGFVPSALGGFAQGGGLGALMGGLF